MIIVYEGNDETLICDKKDEKKMLKEYFINGGRNTEEYDRFEVNVGVIRIRSETDLRIEK